MVYGNAMNNIFRNARHINGMVQQIETTKRIQRPSDDPMISARTMRYRTILEENERFQMNAQSGLAWMEVTESALMNLLNGRDSILHEMNYQFVRAATGTHDIDDQRAIIETIRQMFFQIGQVEMNQTFEGRYVFSGFRTDQPPILTQNMPDATFQITQTISRQDISELLCVQRFNPDDMPTVHERVLVKPMPYRGGIQVTMSPRGAAGVLAGSNIGITPATPASTGNFVIHARYSDCPLAYQPPPGVIHFIPETGELIFNEADIPHIPADGMGLTYTRTGFFAGEPNPTVYFPSRQFAGSPSPPGPATVTLQQETRLVIDTLMPDGTTLPAGTILPAGTEVNWNTVLGEFDISDQHIHFEFANNLFLPINSFARDIFTPQMIADLKRLIEFSDSLVSSDPADVREYFRREHNYEGEVLTNAVNQFISDENARFRYLMHDRFNNMMERHTGHMTNAQTQHTNLGTRMARLDMLYHRLEEDHIHYTALLSAQEDTDVPGTIIRLNSAQSAFNDSLRATGIVTQLSLANFINR